MWGTARFWPQSVPPWSQVTKVDSMRGQELFQMLSNYIATATELGTVCVGVGDGWMPEGQLQPPVCWQKTGVGLSVEGTDQVTLLGL